MEECRRRVFENGVLRRFGLKRDEVSGEWRKLHNDEHYALYSSPNIIREIKSRRLRWTWHVARMGPLGHSCYMPLGDLREGNHLEDPGVDGRMILKWILEK
jgi:hypothetical protein